MQRRTEIEPRNEEARSLIETLAARPRSDGPKGVDPSWLEGLERIDPYGFAGASPANVASQIGLLREELGTLEAVRALGTTLVGLPGRERPVSRVRLEFERGSVDYRVLWFGDEEVYVLNGASQAFEKAFRRIADRRWVHVDLVTGDTVSVEFDGAGTAVPGAEFRVGQRARRASRLPR
jgi:hypothetical protein